MDIRKVNNLEDAYKEIEYLDGITNLNINDDDLSIFFYHFLEIVSKLLSAKASFVFRCDLENKKVLPITSYVDLAGSMSEISRNDFMFKNNFEILDVYIDITKPLILSNFSLYIKKINVDFDYINDCYLQSIEMESGDKFLLMLAFSEQITFDQRTIVLLDRGVVQVKSVFQINAFKNQIIENNKKLTELRLQLLQSDKMAALGTISAGIAHEINNPLSFISNNSIILKEYFMAIIEFFKILDLPIKDIDVFKKNKKKINYIFQDAPALLIESIEGIERIKEIINGIKTFSRADDGNIKSYDINSCVETALRLVSHELKYKCQVIKSLGNCSELKGSRGQIIQVLTNLLINCSHAISDLGFIQIITKEHDSFVIISIKDNGKGISEENLNQLFTPYFTTKPSGQGIGLGLSISYEIIKSHNGNISVESNLGVGTIFTISLPIK